MTDSGSFLVEEFVHSIAAQLDRVQDTLRMKGLIRPLTYALKDFSLDLNVFPELDSSGQVRFRTAGPNEAGASTVHLAFTTITRAMIEENTVSLQASQGPGLDESGLEPEEQRRLEQIGVRNVAQLQKLQNHTSSSTIQRLARVPADRLRDALSRGRPAVDRIVVKSPGATKPKPVPATPVRPVIHPPVTTPPARTSPTVQPPSRISPLPSSPSPLPLPGLPNPVRVRLEGRNFLGGAAPRVKFEGVPVPIASLDDDALEIDLPGAAGSLTLELDAGQVQVFEIEGVSQPNGANDMTPDDPWRYA